MVLLRPIGRPIQLHRAAYDSQCWMDVLQLHRRGTLYGSAGAVFNSELDDDGTFGVRVHGVVTMHAWRRPWGAVCGTALACGACLQDPHEEICANAMKLLYTSRAPVKGDYVDCRRKL